MGKVTPALQKVLYTVLLLCCVKIGTAQTIGQTLKLTDFAIWGGSVSPSSYKKDSAVIIKNKAIIQGNIGSNHLVDVKNDLTLTGSIYSGNIILFKNNSKVTGNVFAQRKGTTLNPAISAGNNTTIIGILGALGKITVSSGQVTGKVAVAAPTNANYTGPAPSLGFITSFTLPPLPTMPRNTAFDNNVAANIPANNITNPTTPLKPGIYRKLALTGNKTLTFDGPGNYIFYEVDNGTTTNKFVFDFKNSPIGNINIFVIKDARWGTLTASTKNGDFPSRIFTEVHGTGSTFSGNSFVLVGPSSVPSGNYVWLGSVWAPNGGISITFNSPISAASAPQILGAIWSGKTVDIKNDMKLTYVALASPDLSFVDPAYEPPVGGKVAAADNTMGPELLALSRAAPTDPIITNPNNEIFEISSGKVLIEVISKNQNDATLKSQLIALGMTNEKGQPGTIDNGPHIYTQSGYLQFDKITLLKNNPLIQYFRNLYPPVPSAGQTTTQGDVTMRSDRVRERFAADGVGIDGTGVKIGVISDSYNTNAIAAQDDVAQGDLPTDVQLLDPLLQVPGTDEGRAMLQIVHDIAPKAKLAFHTGSLGAGPFARTIREMASQNLAGGKCDVIVDDLSYITEPFQSDGIVARTVNEVVRDSNVVYVTSAGNFGRLSFEGVFNGVSNASVIPGFKFHNFESSSDSTKIYQTLNLKPGSYTIVLQWEDESASLGSATGVQTDMDLYLLSAAGFPLFAFNRSSITFDPFEVCAFTSREECNVKLVVARAPGGTANVRFKYIIFRGDATILDYQTGASIVGHANADSAITVGAMLYANIPPFTPVWPGVASFSSRGGTFTKQNGTYVQRLKPDIIAPNGVNITFSLGGAPFNDGDPYPNFFGTSAAAPHVAAVAALLIQGNKLFDLQSTVQQSEIRQQIQSSAGAFPNLPAGHTFDGGHGFVQADAAMLQIANARPIITSLEAVVPGAQNGADSFVVKIEGQYLTNTTEIFVSGVAVPTTVSPDKTEATAIVPAIPAGEDPPFQLFNAAKSVSGQDGGLSEAKYFFSSKVNITVRAENKSRKYGQNNPPLTAQILRNGVLISSPDSLVKYKLDGTELSLTTIAASASRAALYGIVPSRTTPLAPNDPLLTQYDFTFVSGTLSVEKMPLKITPNNKTVKYGEDPGEILYTYEFDPSVTPSAAFLDEVKELHKRHLADNAIVAINGFNNQTAALSNMSVMVSFQALRNARKFVLQNDQLVPLTNTIDTSQLGAQRFVVDVSGESLTNYITDPASSPMVSPTGVHHARALLNIKPLTNGTAKASVPGESLQPMVNGQLLAMVNGQLKALVNGQLKAIVNGQLMPLVNGNLVGMVNGQLKALVNGQLLALVNGQLMTPDDNGDLQIVQDLTIANGQLKALVNGQLKAIVNGQLKAIVNGVYTDIGFVNGQLKAIVNGVDTDLSYVNGQLKAIVNGQLKALVNGAEVGVDGARVLPNGQAQVFVDNTYIPIANGQLQALVNSAIFPGESQLLSMTNGQLMAIVNNELTFVVFQNGQLKALVNGQLEDQPGLLTNGQLKAIVNGQLQTAEGEVLANGQLKAIVNGEDWVYANGQLKAIVNGQLKALVNNFDVTGANNNSQTVVLVDEDDIDLQFGDIGGMFSVNMITGLTPGIQKLVPGAFVHESFEVTYGLGEVEILPALYITGDNKTKFEGEPNPPLTINYDGFVNGDNENTICSGNWLQSIIAPPSNISINQLGRATNYANVGLTEISNPNNSGNGTTKLTVSPGAILMLTGQRSSSMVGDGAGCPGCVTQHYIGMKDVFSDCFDANGSVGDLDHTFNAPKTPGVYYITQGASSEFNCFDNGSGNVDNDPANAIAVVIVSGADKPSASTIAGVHSLEGDYPITLGGCTDLPNYGVRYTPGTLSVQHDPCLKFHWDGNRNYTDRVNNVTGTPTGGVSNLAPGKLGGVGTPFSPRPDGLAGFFNANNSFSFDGTGYISTGTEGSVSGTDDFSVSAWVQTTSDAPMVIINQRSADIVAFPDGFDGEYYLKIGGTHYEVNPGGNAGRAYFFIYDFDNNLAETGLLSTTLVNDGNWHHIKGERIGTTINLYVDGLLEATANTFGVVDFSGIIPTYIGADVRDNASFFNGLIDDIRVAICQTPRPGASSKPVTSTKIRTREDRLFPNPTTGFLRLILSDAVKSVNEIQVFDVAGRMQIAPSRKLAEANYDINVSRLANGVYFIKVKTSEGFKTFRFIKM